MSSERTAKKSKSAPSRVTASESQLGISVSVRFPTAMIRRAEGLADRMAKDQPGINVARAGLLRVALLRGLDALEADKRGRRRHNGSADEEVGELQTALRLSADVVERIDALAQRSSQPGLTVSRSEAVRLAILVGLDVLEKERHK